MTFNLFPAESLRNSIFFLGFTHEIGFAAAGNFLFLKLYAKPISKIKQSSQSNRLGEQSEKPSKKDLQQTP